jgi:5-methylcytosine-specific restriction endonuclease McrA
MKPYVKTYLKVMGFTTDCKIPCEICSKTAVDIHHIEARSKHKELINDISNLMALCRDCHIIYGDKKEHKEYLKNIHNGIQHKAIV